MRWNKLTVLIALLAPVFFPISSCEPDELTDPPTTYVKRDIIMSGAQQNPANASVATGMLNISYSKVTKTLNYDFTWSQLSSPIQGIGIYGLAPVGYSVFPPAPVTAPIQTISITGAGSSGSRSGSLIVDGSRIKEDNLLNGLYYVNIRTNTYPTGEIRAQIKFD